MHNTHVHMHLAQIWELLMFYEHIFRAKLSLTKEAGELVPVGVSWVGIYSRGESVLREGVSREWGHWDVVTRRTGFSTYTEQKTVQGLTNLQYMTIGSLCTHCIYMYMYSHHPPVEPCCWRQLMPTLGMLLLKGLARGLLCWVSIFTCCFCADLAALADFAHRSMFLVICGRWVCVCVGGGD